MTVPNTAQKLFKATQNFKALAENFALIETDGLSETLVLGLDQLVEILGASTQRIQTLTNKDISSPDPPAERRSRPDLHLDPSKLEKAIDFSKSILQWLNSTNAESIPGPAKAVLRELGTAIMMTEKVVEVLVREYRETPRAGIRTASSEGSPELVLAHSRTTPLLDEWHGKFRLNRTAKELLHEFLQLTGFQDSEKEDREWERKAEKWLLATPKGMILILRVGSYGGQPTIFPKYLPKLPSAGNS